MKIFKKILIILLFLLIIPFCLKWTADIIYCEYLTAQYGNKFESAYKENTMIGEIDYLKVLHYSKDTAHIYFVSENRSSGNILIFKNTNGEWIYDAWEKTVWSSSGSADGFVWPYGR